MKRLRLRTGKFVRYYLYVGINIPMDRLVKEGDRYDFTTGRDRAQFRRILEREKPEQMERIRVLYAAFSM